VDFNKPIARIIIVLFVVGAIVGSVMFTRDAPHSTSQESGDVTSEKNSTVGKLEQRSRKGEEAPGKMESAHSSGDQVEALAPDRLEPFLPESLGGMTRSTFSIRRNSVMGMQMTEARATYMNDEGRSWDLHITDTARAQGLLALGGWVGIEGENETDAGYDNLYRQDGRLVHEQWDRSSSRGEYGVVLGDRFTVELEGQADGIDDLKAALADIDLDALEALKGEGVAEN
jgi:hypothetical protein